MERSQCIGTGPLRPSSAPLCRELQLQRLRQTVSRAAKSPFYGERLAQAGVSAESIKSLDDIRRIPFTEKEDLRARGRDLLSVPQNGKSSGRTCLFGHHRPGHRDLLHPPGYRDLGRSGGPLHVYDRGAAGNVFQNMMGYGLFTGGLGFHYGGERLGALTIPAGAETAPAAPTPAAGSGPPSS